MHWEGFDYNFHHEHILWALGNLSHSLLEISQSFSSFLSQTGNEGPYWNRCRLRCERCADKDAVPAPKKFMALSKASKDKRGGPQ